MIPANTMRNSAQDETIRIHIFSLDFWTQSIMIGDGSLCTCEAELAHNVHHPQDTFTRDMCNLPFLRLASFSSRFSFLFSLETTKGQPNTGYAVP